MDLKGLEIDKLIALVSQDNKELSTRFIIYIMSKFPMLLITM